MRFCVFVSCHVLMVASAFAQVPANNECGAAIAVSDGVNPTAPFGVSGTTFTNVLATNSANFPVNSCGGNNQFHKDVFFTYVATCTGTTTISTCTPGVFAAGTLNDTILEVYGSSSCPTAVPAALACNDQFCSSRSEVALATTAGSTYLIRVGSWSASSSGTFYLSVLPTGPSNDNCGGATPLAVGANGGSTDCATPSAGPSCSGFATPVADVWHSFTPAVNCLLKLTLTGPGADRIGLFSGVCGAEVTAECDSSAPFDAQTAASAGTTYLVRVGRSTAPGADNSYTIVVDCSVLGSNDECAGAIPVADGINPGPPDGMNGFTFTNFGATESAGFGASVACAGSGHLGTSDVFFSYTSMIDGVVRASVCTPSGFVAGSLSDTILEVYDSASCPSGAPAAVACNDQFCGGLSETAFNVTFGATYLIRVSAWSTSNTTEGSFYLSLNPSQNDTCAAAQSIGVGVTHGSSLLAGPTSPALGSCITVTSNDVWYAFTPAAKCDLVVSATPVSRLAIYTGSCAAPTEFFCDNSAPHSIFLPNAVAGTTYLIRVADTSAGNSGPFTLTVACPPPPSNDDCSNPIVVFDGVNPSPPNGLSGSTFTNVGATTSGLFAAPGTCPGSSPGFPGTSDVFFAYTSTCTGLTDVSLCVPSGFASAGFDTILEIYDLMTCPLGSATPIACNDQSPTCPSLSDLTFAATAGVTYLIRVSAWNAAENSEGSFYLTVDPAFCLVLDSPSGPGSARVRNLSGPPNAAALTILTVFAGSYPAGPFFGIDPTYTELLLQLQSGSPPFVSVLNGSGNSTFGPALGLPPFTVYGVSLALNAFGQIAEVSPPTSHTIP